MQYVYLYLGHVDDMYDNDNHVFTMQFIDDERGNASESDL